MPYPHVQQVHAEARIPVFTILVLSTYGAELHHTVSTQKIAPATKFLPFFDRAARENWGRY
jgi:hypothetical protein